MSTTTTDETSRPRGDAGLPDHPLEPFPLPSLPDWRREVLGALKGVPFEKRMVAATPEGIPLKALYTAEDVQGLDYLESLPGEAPFLRATTPLGHRIRPWQVAQELLAACPSDLAPALAEALPRGQDAAVLVLDEAGRAGRDPGAPGTGVGGTSLGDAADLAPLVAVLPDGVPVHVRAGAAALPAAALVLAALEEAGRRSPSLGGSVVFDPLAELASAGRLPFPLGRAYDDLAALTLWAEAGAPSLATLAADAVPWHEAGASSADQLAVLLASAAATLRALEERSVPVEKAARRFVLRVAVGPSLYLEIAKLRAVRLVWFRLLSACGAGEAAASVSLHATGALRDLTAFDRHVNALRATTQAFAAIVGGADVLNVPPYDAPLGTPSEGARRLARNTQLVLREECRLGEVVDPCGGAWAVERLTADLAALAWSRFQEIEADGGLARALAGGRLRERVEASARERAAALATQRDRLVGTNAVPDPREPAPDPEVVDRAGLAARRAEELGGRPARRSAGPSSASLAAVPNRDRLASLVEAARRGATLGELAAALHAGAKETTAPALDVSRAALAFEGLRRSVLSWRDASGRPATVFLALVGRPADLTARLDFTRSFLASGGFALEEGPPFESAAEAAEAAASSRAHACALVSSDERYPELVPPVAAALKRGGTVVLLAGMPKEHVEALRAAGVQEFLHARADAPALLASLFRRIGGAR